MANKKMKEWRLGNESLKIHAPSSVQEALGAGDRQAAGSAGCWSGGAVRERNWPRGPCSSFTWAPACPGQNKPPPRSPRLRHWHLIPACAPVRGGQGGGLTGAPTRPPPSGLAGAGAAFKVLPEAVSLLLTFHWPKLMATVLESGLHHGPKEGEPHVPEQPPALHPHHILLGYWSEPVREPRKGKRCDHREEATSVDVPGSFLSSST